MLFVSLVLNVRFNNIETGPPARYRAVAWAPEMFSPQFFLNLGEVHLSESVCRRSFQAINQRGDGHFRWVGYEDVNMVVLAIEFKQLGLEVQAYLGHSFLQKHPHPVRNDSAAVFRYKDQMCMKLGNHMPAGTKITCFRHRPNHAIIK